MTAYPLDTLPPNPDDLSPFGALLVLAKVAAEGAYSPYSKFRVGAAVVADGTVFTGCNIENASFGLTICAERVAISAAVAAGHRRIDRIAVACIDADHLAPQHRTPCGACRQFMREFAGPEVEVAIDGVGIRTMEQLLPEAFVPMALGISVDPHQRPI